MLFKIGVGVEAEQNLGDNLMTADSLAAAGKKHFNETLYIYLY